MDNRDILTVEQLGEQHRRLLVRIFVICAIACVGLLGAQFYYGVFKLPQLQLAHSEEDDDPNALLKAKDTDRDGISDYDEANVYGTSPYLADSDSDGQDDRTELLAGHDPNCPTGKACSQVTDLQGTTLSPEDIASSPQAPSASMDALKQLTEMSPASVRELMKKNGVSEDVLKKLSDADLMKAYSQALSASGVSAAQQEAIPSNPTPVQIRAMLVEGGMSQADADKLTDAELTKLYQDTLSHVQTKQP